MTVQKIRLGEVVPEFRFYIFLRDAETGQLIVFVKLPWWKRLLWQDIYREYKSWRSATGPMLKWHQAVLAYRQGDGITLLWRKI